MPTRRLFSFSMPGALFALFMPCAAPTIPCASAYANVATFEQDGARMLRTARAQLLAEASKVRRSGVHQREKADFADGFRKEHETTIPARVIWLALSRPAHADPFIDAYIRWQLTGFLPDPSTPAANESLDARTFDKILRNLPELNENPRSNRGLLEMVNAAVSVERLSPAGIARVRELLDTIENRTVEAKARARPADAFRAWFLRVVSDDADRSLRAQLELIGARVRAGYVVESQKQAFERALGQALRERKLDPETPRTLAALAASLEGRRRAILSSFNLVEERAQATFDEAAVYDFEVNRWMRMLDGDSSVRFPDA